MEHEQFESKNRWAFVHVPKCAGSSIKYSIKQENLPIDIFSHSYGVKSIPKDKNIIIVYRDPVDRFVSAFHYAQNIHKEALQFTCSSFIKALQDEKDILHEESLKIIFNNNPNDKQIIDGVKNVFTYIFEPQKSWYCNRDNVKILNFANLQDEWNDFLKTELNHKPLLLSKKTQGKNKVINAINQKKNILNEKEIQFIQDLYLKDVEIFNSIRPRE